MKKNNFVLQSMKDSASRLLHLQMFVASIITIFMGFFFDTYAAYSAIVGGLACVLVNWGFVRIYFSEMGAHAVKKILRNMFFAEAVKFLLNILFFLLAMTLLHVKVLPFLVTYILVQWVYWFFPWLFRNKDKNTERAWQ